MWRKLKCFLGFHRAAIVHHIGYGEHCFTCINCEREVKTDWYDRLSKTRKEIF